MTSIVKRLAVVASAWSALAIGCGRQNEEGPMTPANATGQPRQVPDSRYEGDVRSSTTAHPEDPTRPPETYPNPETTPPEMHPEHEGTGDSSPTPAVR